MPEYTLNVLLFPNRMAIGPVVEGIATRDVWCRRGGLGQGRPRGEEGRYPLRAERHEGKRDRVDRLL